jgi:hypothetical protein
MSDPEDPAPRGRGHWLALVGKGALVVAAVSGVWLWSHPSAFEDRGGDIVGADSWTANTAFYTGLTFAYPQSHGTVTIVSARPRELSARNNADIAFYVCTLDPAAHIGGVLSASDSDIGDSCTALVPAAGATIDRDARPFQVLLMKVIPKKAGQTVTLNGADVTYRHGWQRGTQRLGSDIRIHTTTS